MESLPSIGSLMFCERKTPFNEKVTCPDFFLSSLLAWYQLSINVL